METFTTTYIPQIEKDFEFVQRVIFSCKIKEHIKVARNLIRLFYLKYTDKDLLLYLDKLIEHKSDQFIWF